VLAFSGTGMFTVDGAPTMSIPNLFNAANGDGPAATFGNGHLILVITGTMTINSGASINMDARGFSQNFSYQGTNTGSAGRRA